jgi:DNA-binding IscR family transcriptional regulator
VKLSFKLSVGIHILLVIRLFQDHTEISGKLLSLSTGCNPVVVRGIVRCLKNAGIVSVPRGPGSSTRLLKDANEINLWEILEAVDPEAMEKMVTGIHTGSSQVCPVGRNIYGVLKEPYGKIAGVMENEMRKTTLADLAENFSEEELEAARAELRRRSLSKAIAKDDAEVSF